MLNTAAFRWSNRALKCSDIGAILQEEWAVFFLPISPLPFHTTRYLRKHYPKKNFVQSENNTMRKRRSRVIVNTRNITNNIEHSIRHCTIPFCRCRKICEEGQIRQQNDKNAQGNRTVKNCGPCDSVQNAKEIPRNTTPVETSAKEISNKEASKREKSEEKRPAKDTDASSSNEKEDDEEGERRSTKTENRQSSSSRKDEEHPNEHNESSSSSQSSGGSSGRQQRSATEGVNSAAKKSSSSSFKTLKTECLPRSKHNVPE